MSMTKEEKAKRIAEVKRRIEKTKLLKTAIEKDIAEASQAADKERLGGNLVLAEDSIERFEAQLIELEKPDAPPEKARSLFRF